MKQFFFFLLLPNFLVLSALLTACSSPQAYNVTGMITEAVGCINKTSSNLSITDFDSAKVYPLNNSLFSIYLGSTKYGSPLFSFLTDQSGRFSISLPEGTFCLIDENRLKVINSRFNSWRYDKDCLVSELTSCDTILHVTNTTMVSLIRKNQCGGWCFMS